MKKVIPHTIQNGLSQSDSYILMLAEVDGDRKIPIFIGSHEAQCLLLAGQPEKVRRPMTHQLMLGMMNEYGLTLREVTIDRVDEGVFYATLHVTDGFNNKQFDSRPTDAITLALLCGVDIMVSDSVLEETGMHLADDRGIMAGETPSIEALEEELRRCEENEDYERAAEIQKKIEEMGKK